MPDFRLPRRAASNVDFVAPRPKFVWPRREPLSPCLDAAAHVPHDGGREPGTGVLRPVRGVRGPRHAGMCPIGAPDGRGRDDSRAIQRGSTSLTHVPYLAVSFRRPTTWKTFAIIQKMGFSWTNRLPTFCATV